MQFGVRMQQKCYIFPASRQVYNADTFLITGDVNINHLDKLVSAGFATIIVSIFPFIVNKHLEGCTWR